MDTSAGKVFFHGLARGIRAPQAGPPGGEVLQKFQKSQRFSPKSTFSFEQYITELID